MTNEYFEFEIVIARSQVIANVLKLVPYIFFVYLNTETTNELFIVYL